jgi:LytS/YehU family sensor histidine kinase
LRTLPSEVIYAFLATPVVIQPIVNPDFFREPLRSLLLEVAANYVPASAIALGLVLVYVGPWPGLVARLPRKAGRLAAHVLMCAAIAALAGVVVRPLHMLLIGESIPALPYAQRNVGFTCLLVLPALLLDAHRARARDAERKVFELEHAALKAELDALRSRTEPHFLFNALNTIASLVRDDAALAERVVLDLASVLRFAVESARSETVTLDKELAIVDAYLAISGARFGDRLVYTLDVPSDARHIAVPPFVLQPLVENAVLHGIGSRVKGGCVRVEAVLLRAHLALRVEDDGPGLGHSSHRGSGTSLTALARRLVLVYGEAASLVQYTPVGGGFGVELRVPLGAVTP